LPVVSCQSSVISCQFDRVFSSVVDEIDRAAPGLLTHTDVEYLT
jgi:hypothetical protein